MTHTHAPTTTFRINILDARGTVSLLAPPHGPKMLTAIAGLGLQSARELLLAVSALDPDWIQQAQAQLALFDEFNLDTLAEDWQAIIEAPDSAVHPAFRVIDPVTRARSLQPSRLGLIVFNLKDQRIIQIHNTWEHLTRHGEGRYRQHGRPQGRRYTYTLPDNWRLVP